ncbi:MAG: hypothetical protein FJ212_08375 [Ignavibacteria bacterium]|nr:hypothetical protein [Ignavibacteria bacterium]
MVSYFINNLNESLMNDAHIHLLVNHLPIILPMIAVIARIVAFFMDSDALKRFAMIILILSGICAFASMQSGERAEEMIESTVFFSETHIEAHEEAAETFAIFSYVIAVMAIVSLWADFKKKSFAVILTEITLGLCIVSFYFAQKTGTTGGEIRHEEIRKGFVAPESEHHE